MKCNLMAPINRLGYGIVGLNIAKSAIENNIDLGLHFIGSPQPELLEPKILEASQRMLWDSFDNKVPLIKIWHQFALLDIIPNNRYLAWPIFELDTFTDLELKHLRIPDEIIVCSQWAKEIVQRYLPSKPVHTVPLGVDRSIFYQSNQQRTDKYIFFTIGKLEYRKGHDLIVSCFNKAFTKEDNVELKLMINNPFLSQEVGQEWKNTYLKSNLNVSFQNSVNTHADVANFINSCDCGIFISRAEGWNLELLESMSCSKPVIATNYSGHTEFCDTYNSRLVEIKDTEPAYDKMGGMWFRGQGNWAELCYDQEEQIIEHMRYMYKNNIKYNEHGRITAEKFTWNNSIKHIKRILK